MITKTVASFRGKDATVLIHVLHVLSKLSPYARITVEDKSSDMIIYSVARSELAAGLLRLANAMRDPQTLDRLFKVSVLSGTFIRKIMPKELLVLDDGILLIAKHYELSDEVCLKLSWIDTDYPPPPPLGTSYEYIFNINKKKAYKVFDLFSMSALDDIEVAVENGRLCLRGIGCGVALTIYLENGESESDSSIRVYVPSTYAKLLRYFLALLENPRIYLSSRGPLVVSGHLPLSIASTLYFVVTSRVNTQQEVG